MSISVADLAQLIDARLIDAHAGGVDAVLESVSLDSSAVKPLSLIHI